MKPKRGATEAPHRVMLVDDHPVWRDAVREIIEQKAVGEVVVEVSTGGEVLGAATRFHPDIVVMEMGLPDLDGASATRGLIEAMPQVKILVLSASDEESDVLAAVRAGANGYLLKTAGSAEIVDALKRISDGELVLPPRLAGVVLRELRGSGSKKNPLSDLSPREQDVLALIAEGRSNQAICDQLRLTPKTVEAHVRHIFRKLGLEPAPDEHRRVVAALTYLRWS